jgi:hypothetical protein
MVRIKSSQKIFTEDEVVSLTGICTDHLRKPPALKPKSGFFHILI